VQDSDISALEWLRREGESERVIALAECIYANDFGTSLRHLGVREMQVCTLSAVGPILRSHYLHTKSSVGVIIFFERPQQRNTSHTHTCSSPLAGVR
jgi:hypothetical protein